MSRWLLKVGLGTVQNLIAEARKTRDLAAGSAMVSKTMRAVIDEAEQRGATCRVPADPKVACPHLALFELDAANEGTVTAFGAALHAAARKFLVNALVPPDAELGGIPYVASEDERRAQVEAGVELYWAAVPMDGDYGAAFHRCGKAFAARKLTRTFPQLGPLAKARQETCAQCGARVAVVQPNAGMRPKMPRLSRGRLDARDRLCAVCLGKRLWAFEELGPAYPSTVSLARDRFFRMPLFHNLRDSLEYQGLGRDRQLELLARWDELAELDVAGGGGAGTDALEDDLEKLLQGYRLLAQGDGDFRREVEAFEKLSPYYAQVVLDGDHMGDWFGGKDGRYAAPLDQAQKVLGGALAAFSKALQGLDLSGGKLVYVGGDDAFALLPLDLLLPFMEAAHELWEENVRKPLQPILANDWRPPTMSLHASVLHEHAPLQPAVRRLHALLDDTKELADRDAFSILADVRSGAPAYLIARWEGFQKLVAAIELLGTWRMNDIKPPFHAPTSADLTQRAGYCLSSRLPYQMLRILPGYFDVQGRLLSCRALTLELGRLCSRGPSGAAGGAAATGLIAWLGERARGGMQPASGAARVTGREAVASALEVTAFLARQLDWGGGP